MKTSMMRLGAHYAVKGLYDRPRWPKGRAISKVLLVDKRNNGKLVVSHDEHVPYDMPPENERTGAIANGTIKWKPGARPYVISSSQVIAPYCEWEARLKPPSWQEVSLFGASL